MVGIASIGVYLPKYRISEKMINEAWGRPGGRNERTTAYFDEDSLTMGLAAVTACLGAGEPEGVENLTFSSTTSPFREKLASATLAMILNLPAETRTLDLASSLRSGTSAVLAAFDAVRAGSARKAVVAASECGRIEPPGGMNEALWGDGAGALEVGSEDLLLSFLGSTCISDEITHFWRRAEDRYVQSEDVRFPQIMGYGRIMEGAVAAFLKKSGLSPKDLAKVVIDGPDGRSHLALMRKFGFDPKTQVQDVMHPSLGSLGSAHPFVMLAAALDGLKAGDKVLWGSYGDGCDLLLLEATEKIERAGRGLLKPFQDRRETVSNYTRYLSFRKIFETEAIGYYSSLSAMLRERDRFSRLIGGKCGSCGYITTLPLRVCPACRSKDSFDNLRLARTGKIFTFTQEWYYPSPEPPTTLAVVDLDGGGRLYCQMTDCSDPTAVRVGMAVEMVVRKYHEAINLPHYYWKCRPVPGGATP